MFLLLFFTVTIQCLWFLYFSAISILSTVAFWVWSPAQCFWGSTMSWRCSSCWQPWCFTTSSFFKHMHPCWTSTASSSTKQKSRKGDSLLNTLVICIMGFFQVYPFLGHSSSSTPDSVNHLFRILLCAQGHCQAETENFSSQTVRSIQLSRCHCIFICFQWISLGPKGTFNYWVLTRNFNVCFHFQVLQCLDCVY